MLTRAHALCGVHSFESASCPWYCNSRATGLEPTVPNDAGATGNYMPLRTLNSWALVGPFRQCGEDPRAQLLDDGRLCAKVCMLPARYFGEHTAINYLNGKLFRIHVIENVIYGRLMRCKLGALVCIYYVHPLLEHNT